MNYIFGNSRFIPKLSRVVLCRNYKVSILGASGGVGQPLGLFLKKTPLVTELALYDVKGVKGVAADLSHIERKGRVVGYEGTDELKACLDKSDIVVITAGIPRQLGMSRTELFEANAPVVADLTMEIANTCPGAAICIITSPINSIVPMCAQVLHYFSVFDPHKLFGITTLDVIRAITFIAKIKKIDVTKLNVTVIGGHSATTTIPVMSQCIPALQFPLEERNMIAEKIRNAATEVLEAKQGQGSATLSMAWAAYRFVNSLIEAKDGKQGVIEPAFVKSDETECEFFSTPLILGSKGVERNLGLSQMTDYEMYMLKNAIPEIKRDIVLGKSFASGYLSKMGGRD